MANITGDMTFDMTGGMTGDMIPSTGAAAPPEVTAFSEYGDDPRIETIFPSEVITYDFVDASNSTYRVQDRNKIKANDDSLTVLADTANVTGGNLRVLFAHWSQSARPSSSATTFPADSEIVEAGAGVESEQYYGTDYGTPNSFGSVYFANTISFRIRVLQGSPIFYSYSLRDSSDGDAYRGRVSGTGSVVDLSDISMGSPSGTYQTVFATISSEMTEAYLEIKAIEFSSNIVEIEVDSITITRT